MNLAMANVSFSVLCVCTLAVFAALWDLTQRRIPNTLILVGFALGFALQLQAAGLDGLLRGLGGAALALAIYFIPFSLRQVGGGDVKLAMVFGVFLGWKQVLSVILIGTVLNGLVALTLLIAKRVLIARGRALPPKLEQVPKAVALGLALFYVALRNPG